jgi:polyisoprenoid-binding protein YceI
MRYLLATLLTTATLFSANLTFSSGSVEAHTKIMGDSNINPSSSNIVSHLTMDKGDVTTLKGSVDVSLVELKSENEDRDEHMHETINVDKYAKTTYTINSVEKNTAGTYNISGTLSLHGITKNIDLLGTVIESGESVSINAKTTFNMSDFGIEPPSMLFLTVRDLLEMSIDTTYTIEP